MRFRRHSDLGPALDDHTVERLLAGALDPADAPPGYREVAAAIAAARAAPAHVELAGEPAALAAFRAGHTVRGPGRRPDARRSPLRGGLGRAVGVAVAATMLTATAAVAVTGALPLSGRDSGERAPSVATSAPIRPAEQLRSAPAGRPPTAPPSTVDGLCRAWAAAPGRLTGTAFDRLASVAGGRDRVAAYCAARAGRGAAEPTRRGGPERTGAAGGGPEQAGLVGLCRAWAAGNRARPTPAPDRGSTARLAEAAGGVDRIPGFCARIVPAADPPAPAASPGAPPGAAGRGNPGDRDAAAGSRAPDPP